MTPSAVAPTPFGSLALLESRLEATTKRLEKRALLVAFLRSLGRAEIRPAVHLIIGRIFAERDARTLNLGWATVRKALGRTRQASLVAEPLTILDVARAFDEIAASSGPVSGNRRRRLLESLLGRATSQERDILLRAVFGEMRVGVNEGVMLEAISDASGIEPEVVRTAQMLMGDLGEMATVALFGGREALVSHHLRLLSPVKPMLAEMAEDVGEILEEHGGKTSIEFKLDGARIQIHRLGPDVRIFSRRLSDVTASLPELVELAMSLPSEAFLAEALEAGHEGLMAKSLGSSYTVGKRGKKWFKLKPADRLDLVIVAAEWGSGRREGWLSNYWLAVRDSAAGTYPMIGKTYKGLTDEEYVTMTERMKALAVREERWGFHVRPEVVVEVAYNEIQKSPHYASGFALRFARIVRIRDDKGPEDVDTYARLKGLYAKQFERKGRGPEPL